MVEKIAAALGLAACLALLAGMAIGPMRLRRWREALRRSWQRHHQRTTARREAQQAIERARRGVRREGNVIRPKSFERPTRRDDA